MKIIIGKRIYSVVTVAVLVFTLFLLPVRAEESPGFLSDSVNPEKTSLTDFTPVEKPKLKWKVSIPPINSHESIQPIIAKGGKILYVASGGYLSKIEIATGKEIWKENIKTLGYPHIIDDTLYITGAKYLRAYDIRGETPVQKWEFLVRKPFSSDSKYCSGSGGMVTATKEMAIFGFGKIGMNTAGDTNIRAVDSLTGKELWAFDAKQIIAPAKAVDEKNGICFFITVGESYLEGGKPRLKPNGYLGALDLKTGQEKWRIEMESTGGATGPTVSDGIVYAGSNKELFAINGKTGQEIWRVKRKVKHNNKYFFTSAVLTKDLFVANMGAFVEAYGRKDGKLIWSQKLPSQAYFMVAAKEVLYVPMYDVNGEMLAISLADGKTLWSFAVKDGKSQCKGIAVGDGVIYFGTYASKLYCIENEK